jgi:choice-of-anchor A domain-containing protein
MRGAWLVCGAAAASLAAWTSVGGATASSGVVAPARAAVDQCASLGQAAGFAVFSGGDFNATQPSGTSITGRIAAAGDVTLDGVSVNPASGDAAPTVIAGGNFTAGQTTGHGGSLNGGVSYGGTIDVASNFTVNGGETHAPPPFSFTDEFDALALLSSSLGELPQSAGAVVSSNPYSHALELTGTGTGLNVFEVSATQLSDAAGIVLNLTQPGATAVLNITTDTELTIAPQYMTLSGSATAGAVVWNLPLATGFAVTTGVRWQGLILAPNAAVTSANHPQLNGQIVAKTVPSSDWVLLGHPAFTGCLPPPTPSVPPPPPDTTLGLQALCVDANGDLDMRLRNTGEVARGGNWEDIDGRDFGHFEVPADSDLFFLVHGATAGNTIRATSGGTVVDATATDRLCAGQITVHLVTVGDAPAGQTWPVRITGGGEGNGSTALTMGSGDYATVTVRGGYEPGTPPIDQVVGGIPYTISEDDAHGAEVTISLNPLEILDGQNELVTVTNSYPASEPAPPEIVPIQPPDPTLPPGAPEPPPGPGMVGASSGADLTITHQIAPSRLPVGGTIETVTQVRNIGEEAAEGVIAREIPQFRPSNPNSVARVLSLTTTSGRCTQRRPVRCQLGTLAPGAVVTIRTRTRVLVAATLRSVVVVSSNTPETNTANNMAEAGVRTFLTATAIRARISAPAYVPFGRRLTYRVTVTGGAPSGATSVRLCTRPPTSLIEVRAPGASSVAGRYCRDIGVLGRGRSTSFLVSALAAHSGPLTLYALATAASLTSPSRDSTTVLVGAPPACAAVDRAHTPPPNVTKPVAHVAC